MIKTLKVLTWLSLIATVLLYVMIIFAANYDGPSSGVLAGMRDAICSRFDLPKGQAISAGSAGYLFGSFTFPKVVKYGMLLFVIHSRKKRYYNVALVVFILLIISAIGNQEFPFYNILVTILLFTKPVREYFKKPTEPKQPEFDFEKNIVEQ